MDNLQERFPTLYRMQVLKARIAEAEIMAYDPRAGSIERQRAIQLVGHLRTEAALFHQMNSAMIRKESLEMEHAQTVLRLEADRLLGSKLSPARELESYEQLLVDGDKAGANRYYANFGPTIEKQRRVRAAERDQVGTEYEPNLQAREVGLPRSSIGDGVVRIMRGIAGGDPTLPPAA